MKYIVLVFAFALSGCIFLADGEWISPAEAQRIERAECNKKADAEDRRRCHSMVDKRYSKYNSMGGYPSSSPGAACGAPMDCRGAY